MPTLFLSSNYSLESRRLRAAAERLGWNTCRVDRPKAEDLADCALPYAVYAPPKQAIPLARCLSHDLLSCPPHWLPELPEKYRSRTVSLCDWREAARAETTMFVKPVKHGVFPSTIYEPGQLTVMTTPALTNSMVQMADPVAWRSEFRCFIHNRGIVAISCYRYMGRTLASLDDRLPVPQGELADAERFCEELLADANVEVPSGVVIDVGEIDGKGLAVVEANEAWNSSIYTCSPETVLRSLLASCAPDRK